MSMNSNKKQNQETNNVKNQKEEKEMANAYDDEMDLRDEAQKEAEDQENKKENKDNKGEEPSFYEKHKVAIWIGAGVVGVAGLGFGLWGVHNIGMGKTFLGAPKYHGGHKSHGRYPYNANYKVQQMPQQAYVPTQQQVDIPATESEPAKVVDFAEGAAKVVDTAKKIGDLKVNNL